MKKNALILANFFLLILPVLVTGAETLNAADLEGDVIFLPQTPIIDGVLDDSLKPRLQQRLFSEIEKVNTGQAPVPAHYRLAYGTHFLYLYIEAKADDFIFRDRAYQNGDGFHMVIAKPKAGAAATDEFYVLAAAAVNNPRMTWTKKVFWYYNVTNIFIPTSKKTKMEFKAHDGVISFELLLPWNDVNPYHPWLNREGIGFNLCFVKAADDGGKCYHFVLKDKRIQSELSKRQYVRLKFQPPELSSGVQTFARISQNHITRGEKVDVSVVSIGKNFSNENLRVTVKSGEGERLMRRRKNFSLKKNITRFNFSLDTSGLPSGGYRVNWFSRSNDAGSETGLTILPVFKPEDMRQQLESVRVLISPGSLTTLQFLLEEMEGKLVKVKSYETCAKIRVEINRFLDAVKHAEKGTDVFAGKRGFFRRAFRSKVDNTLQPYSVRVPHDFDPTKKYPLMVFLHGSASDETDLEGFHRITGENFIQLGPRARGTSNVYVEEHAQEDIAEAINAVIENYPVDKARIFLSGFSMGGYGVYRTYYETPDKFRALVVMSGNPNLARQWKGGNYPNFLEKKYLKPFKNIPMFIFHGERDRNCPFSLTKELIKKLESAGAEVTFVSEADKGHEAPGEETLMKYYQWLDEQVKE